jgi:hypothetical protein
MNINKTAIPAGSKPENHELEKFLRAGIFRFQHIIKTFQSNTSKKWG